MTSPAFKNGDKVVYNHPQLGRQRGAYIAPTFPDGMEGDFSLIHVDPFINDWTVPTGALQPAIGARDMVAGDLVPLSLLKAAYEVEFLGTLWTHGDSGLMTPYVCSAIFGDGLALARIFTTNQRPNYHLVRIDSSWTEVEISRNWDDILTAIEEECGIAGECLDDPCDNCRDTICKCGADYSADREFPALDADDGGSFSIIPYTDVINVVFGKKRRLALAA